MNHQYRGRFAPTPSGPLHFGSLVAAVGSYLEARRQGGTWLVRIEDLDPPRVVPGAADAILRTLEAFGFTWQEPVMWQSSRSAAYRKAFETLQANGRLFACACSRSILEGSACSGLCQGGLSHEAKTKSWRFRAPETDIYWQDRLQGSQCDCLALTGKDFVVLRGDGVFSYQLAVVVDDAQQAITDVVRGADLLDSTARQIALQQALRLPTPRYMHLPIARNARGEKLSKQTRASPISPYGDAGELVAALRFLGQPVVPGLETISEVWDWALANWQPEFIPV